MLCSLPLFFYGTPPAVALASTPNIPPLHRASSPHHSPAMRHTTNDLVMGVLPGTIEAGALSMPDRPLTLRRWDGTLDTLRKRALARTPSWSAVMIDNTSLQSACRDGLVQMLPADTGGSTGAQPSPCGLAAGHSSLVLAWDQRRIGANAAPDWAAFWDVARHPGKRGLRLDPRTTLEIALMADGVSASNVYATLSTPNGVDRAFRKLNQLRPYIVWWRTPDDAARIMVGGEALMVSTPADELASVENKSGFIAQWHQSLRQELSWAVPHDISDANLRRITAILREQTPHHDDVLDSGPSDNNALEVDDAFWADHLDTLQSRFQSWFNSTP